MSQPEDRDLSIWDLYKLENLAKPQNVSQLMKWTKQTDTVRSLRFFEAKKIFKLKSMQDLNTPKDIAQEKLELKEWIADCKEEIICLRSDELQTEDDFEESMESLNIKFDHILNKFHDAKQIIIKRRTQRYNMVQKSVKEQQILLRQALHTLSKTLFECDIKCDKSQVHNVLNNLPEFTEIEYNALDITDLKPLKREISKLSFNHSHGDSKQLLEFKGFSEFKNDDELDTPDGHDHIEMKENDEIVLLSMDNLLISGISGMSIHLTSPIVSPRLETVTPTRSPTRTPFTPSSLSPINLKKKKKRKKLKRKDFQFMSVIGRGTFGKIMLVKKKADGTKYAMKVLKKTQLIAQQQEDNINQEIKVLKTMKHPFLLRAHYVFQTESKIYLVLDYFRYGDLMSHLKIKKKFSQEEAKYIVAEVALAIGCLHSGGIVYRDLKPENLLMDEYGHICLCDFGLCKKIGNGVMNTFCGTPDYLAPEILSRCNYDKNVDWWSFGILLFELVVGIVPFYSSSNMEMYQKIKNQRLMFPSYIYTQCQDLITKLLNRDPTERLGCVDDVVDIRKHEWFANIDWIKLLNREVVPLYRPRMHGQSDSDYSSDGIYTDYDYNNQDDNLQNFDMTPTPNVDKGLLANYAI